MIYNFNRNVKRHFKVGGRYGDAIGQDNGSGQGDPFALLIALVYVGIQMLAVGKACPQIAITPVVDDRTIRGGTKDTKTALSIIDAIDRAARHLTNARKCAALVTSQHAGAEIETFQMSGQCLPIQDCEVLVGEPMDPPHG